MQYKLIGNNDTSNIIQTVLHNRGIEDWQGYLNLYGIDDEEFQNLSNIDMAVRLFELHVSRNDDIGILADTDTDGVCSSTIMYKYIQKAEPQCKVHMIIHEKPKAHGLSSKDFEIPESVKLLIIPDSSSNDIDECQELIDTGMSVIILDHHIFNADKPNPAILINNQTSEAYTNKDACGAHITYDYCKALDSYYWTDYADDLIDLVALADLADSMSIKSFPTRAAINQGLNNIQNKMFKEILKAQEFSTKGVVSPFTVNFYIAPLVNAFLRMATFEERQLLYKAFCEDESETFEYTKRGEDFPTEENIYEHIVRLMKSYKAKQDRQRKNSLPKLVEMADENDKVAIIDSTGIIDNSLTGVTAIKVSETLNKPTLLLQRRDDKTYGGSGRAFDNCPIEDFRALVDSCPYVTFGTGHSSAFGISIPVDNIEATKQWLNEQLADVSMDKIYTVDFEVYADELETQMFQVLDNNKTLWGHSLDQPLFAIKDLHLTAENTKICGKKRDTIQIYDKDTDVQYVMFFCKEDSELYQWISSNWGDEETDITVVGTLGLSYYDGKFDCQVKIKDSEIVKTIIIQDDDISEVKR